MSEETTNTVTTSFECPHCGEKIEFETEAPQRRGQLAGLELDEMSDEQLKREITNAKSVLYKAQKRGASEETIAKNKARVDAAVAEKASRQDEARLEEQGEEVTDEESPYAEDE